MVHEIPTLSTSITNHHSITEMAFVQYPTHSALKQTSTWLFVAFYPIPTFLISNRACLLPLFFETVICLCFPGSLPGHSLCLYELPCSISFASSWILLLLYSKILLLICSPLWMIFLTLYFNDLVEVSPKTLSLPLISLYNILLTGGSWPVQQDF